MRKQLDITNRVFGRLTALSCSPGSKPKWLCSCTCGGQRTAPAGDLTSGRIKSCGCLVRDHAKKMGPNHNGWKGVGGIYKSEFNKILSGAKKRDLTFAITMEQIWELFLTQGGKCAITGEPLRLKQAVGDYTSTASLDRIDSSVGYVLGNVQWVHKYVNIMKWDLTEDEFFDWCGKVWLNRQRKIKAVA